MAQPILVKRSFVVAVLIAIQAIVPSAVALLSLSILVGTLSQTFNPYSWVVVTLLCLVLIQTPRDVGTQLTNERVSAVADVMFRWALLLLITFVIHHLTAVFDEYPPRLFWYWALITTPVLILATLGAQQLMRVLLVSAFNDRKAIIAGYNVSSLELARRLRDNPGLGLHVEGFFDDRSHDRLEIAPDATLIGSLGEVAAYVNEHRTDLIFIALPIRHVKRVMSLLDELRDTTASIYYVPDIFVFDLIQARSGDIHGIPVVAMCETPFYGYRGVSKRLTDLVFATIILVLTLPLLVLIGILVKITSPGPMMFVQRRYGLDGREISVYKFRTMRVTEDGAHVQQATKGDPRITPIGGLLRRSSLDELPQLINVLQGRMSLVGPRPHAVAHNELYRKLIKGYMLRHKVLPGITGLAQVSGCRGETAELHQMEARVRYDLEYLRHWTPMLDVKIILLTAIKVFRDDRAY
ncbi:MAG: undecaprenyl-phosphate glucose phosphotransferase [Steroidobacterales bacterium]